MKTVFDMKVGLFGVQLTKTQAATLRKSATVLASLAAIKPVPPEITENATAGKAAIDALMPLVDGTPEDAAEK